MNALAVARQTFNIPFFVNMTTSTLREVLPNPIYDHLGFDSDRALNKPPHLTINNSILGILNSAGVDGRDAERQGEIVPVREPPTGRVLHRIGAPSLD